MRKDQQEELQRLEDALMADAPPEESLQAPQDDTDLLLQEIYGILEDNPQPPQTHMPPKPHTPPLESHRTYNTDKTDVDLDQLTEALQEKPKGRGCLWSAILTATGMLLLTIWYLLRILGVSP